MHLGWLSATILSVAFAAFRTAEVGFENMSTKTFIILVCAVIYSTFVFPDEED